ncbi:four helix bundle protein [Flavobacteriaceae bacterium]|jgi:four helix bundle protein|nr:four helix bundle protein [Flavobacteriaceae bacterium]MDA7724161.1 four helix bundle protein [Flavobacteriaceae bacterium]MDA7728287.1 four helix bundle protein [Flavobacteriaceae bacterium]MDA7848944.1 four helix bundle protein [Flavobacteriaceae bacterium]MDB4178561.1 four helix bundle protein [Flavobacteriaceae bacterium]|tara:strand:+ start:3360 stop:3713 length:354 start_codon:yes stop_codon:yes gene_type:complete
MHKFEELKIWQKSMAITEKCYKETENFPNEEKYGLTSQLRRSAVSIPSNISEGAGRNTNGEFKQFLGIANGSSYELLTQLYLSLRLKLIKEENVRPIINEVLEVTKMNFSLQRSLNT